MVLEATCILVDNSEFMRNGDYPPTRFEAQHDAVNLVCGAKTQQNPENTVGILTYAGKRPELLVTPTSDLGKILQSLHHVKLGGSADLANALQVAQLALKHRQNKNQRQRIVAFVGSPVSAETSVLVQIGKKLKKNNVAVDIVNFGEEAENTEKLEAFLNAVISNDNSHLITIPPGPHILSDILLTSPLICGDGEGNVSAFAASAAASAGAATAAGGFDFGVDPSVDPELAMALRISMEEERQRQEAEAKKRAETEGRPTDAAVPAPEAVQSTGMDIADDDDALLARAIAMSMVESNNTSAEPQNDKDKGDNMDASG
eukprot:tig00000829_g4652.t1